MKQVPYDAYAGLFYEQLASGILCNTQLGDRINTMTIGWGALSILWGRPIVMVPIRTSRYTHTLLEQSGVFTVSVPQDDRLKEQIALCGVKSGRDVDKFEQFGLTPQPGIEVKCPIVQECFLHYECRVIGSMQMDATTMAPPLYV